MRAYLELTKPRITVMVLATTAVGWALAGGGITPRLWLVLAGTTLASAAAGTLNQYLERREDALMERTKSRPLPSGRIEPAQALSFGITLAALGLALNLLAGAVPCALTLATLALYLGAYTPLKRVSPVSTWPGSIAGALPPVIGWAAAHGSLRSPFVWAMFGMQMFWQMDHFLAIFRLYREDYARAGFRVMPVVDGNGGNTAAQIALHALTVLLAAMAPYLLGYRGLAYGAGALLLSSAYLALGMRASWTLERADTRRLFFASLAYLPLLFTMLLLGGIS